MSKDNKKSQLAVLVVGVFLIGAWPGSAASDEWTPIDPEIIEILFAPNGEPLIADEAYQLTTHAGYARNAIFRRAQMLAFLTYNKAGHSTYFGEAFLEPRRLLDSFNKPAPSNISNSKTVHSHLGPAKYITFDHGSFDCFAATVFWLPMDNGYRRVLDTGYCRRWGGPIEEPEVGSVLSSIGIAGEKEPPALTARARKELPRAAAQEDKEQSDGR